MSTVEDAPKAVGDWSIRGMDPDCIFSGQELSDTALSAAIRTSAKFDQSFPGWELYRRVVAGVGIHDRKLEDWAVVTAQMLATSERANGKPYLRSDALRSRDWLAQAGRDALDFVIHGKYAASTSERAKHFGVHWTTYRAVRDPVAAGICIGLETYRSILHAEYFSTRRDEKMRNL